VSLNDNVSTSLGEIIIMLETATRHRLSAAFLVLAVSFFLTFAASAQSKDYPDITGKWSVETKGAIIGNPPQWPRAGASGSARLQQMHATVVIEHQEGDRFWGAFVTPTHTQKFVGIFTGEDQRFLLGMEHGIGLGSVVSGTKLRWCYTQVRTKEIAAQIAGCNDASRQ
jgi:hypothetical protein